ncbi:MAG: hypothetical protein P8012_13485, partial [Desulfobacterales bacterium]
LAVVFFGLFQFLFGLYDRFGGFFDFHDLVLDFNPYRPSVRVVDGWLPENKTTEDLGHWLEKYRGRMAGIFCDPAGDAANEMTHYTAVEQLANTFPGVKIAYPTSMKQRSIQNGTELLRRLIRNAKGEVALQFSRSLVNKREGEYTSVFGAFRHLKYPEIGQKRVDDKYFKDGTNDHPVDAFRYGMVMQFLSAA